MRRRELLPCWWRRCELLLLRCRRGRRKLLLLGCRRGGRKLLLLRRSRRLLLLLCSRDPLCNILILRCFLGVGLVVLGIDTLL